MTIARSIQRPAPQSELRRRGFTLIETLVYIVALGILLGVGYVAMHRSANNSVLLQSSVNDIARAMRAGERWRADVRSAKGSLQLESDRGTERLVLQTAAGEVAWQFSDNTISRRAGTGPWIRLLENVKLSAMQPDRRPTVSAWRWELELNRRSINYSRTRPLFTFFAVPPAHSSP